LRRDGLVCVDRFWRWVNLDGLFLLRVSQELLWFWKRLMCYRLWLGCCLLFRWNGWNGLLLCLFHLLFWRVGWFWSRRLIRSLKGVHGRWSCMWVCYVNDIVII
jgi:hypothetical protein